MQPPLYLEITLEVKTGFKILTKIEDRLFSWAPHYWNKVPQHIVDLCNVEYKVGKWTYPKIKNTNLYLFSDDSYRAFRNIGDVVYKCYYIKSESIEIVGRQDTIESFIGSKLGKNDYSGAYLNMDFPRNTVAATCIKLIKEVK